MDRHISPALIDFHQHAMPMPVLEWLAARGQADLAGVEEGYVTIDSDVSGVPKGARIPLPRSHYDASVRLGELGEMRLDGACISLPPFLLAAGHRDPGFVMALVSLGNRALIDWCRAAPERLHPNPTVPLGLDDYDTLTWELLGVPDSPGISLATSGLGAELDDPRHEPIWAMLADSGRFAFLHPSQASSPERHAPYWLTQLVGYPAETALVTARLLLSGALDRHDFPLILAHAGGCLPSLGGRLDLGWTRKPQTHTVPAPPTDYLKRLYYDSAAFSPQTLAFVADTYGQDRIVVGTDWPFDLSDPEPTASLRAAGGEVLLAAARTTGSRVLERGRAAAKGQAPRTPYSQASVGP